ncbi:MAG: sugar phosphate isomerase/epimerase family protein [Armatimonadota bacterium]
MYASVRDDIVFLGGFSSIAEGLNELGFNAVELIIEKDYTVSPIFGRNDRLNVSSDAGLAELKNQLAKASAKVSAFLMGNNFGSDDLDGEIEWAVKTIQVAARLGVPAVRIDAAMQGESELPLEKRVEIFAGAMARILEATDGLDVDMGIENHSFQGNQPEFLDMLMEKVGSPRLGLTLDTGNFYWAGFPLDKVYEILEHLAPKAKHTHVKNINYPAEFRNVQRELGWEYQKYMSPIKEGDIDHARVLSILKKAGYDRDFCLEDESLWRFPKEERGAILKRDADYFREIL